MTNGVCIIEQRIENLMKITIRLLTTVQRGMLARLIAAVQSGEIPAATLQQGGIDVENGVVVVNENCNVSSALLFEVVCSDGLQIM